MSAITHAVTALPLRRRYAEAGIWPILIAVQLVELLWVVFTCTGVEHYVVSGDHVHLSFLPYSHSVATCTSIVRIFRPSSMLAVTVRAVPGGVEASTARRPSEPMWAPV